MKETADIWLCDLTHTYQTVAINRIPLGIGMLASYCKKSLKERVSLRLYKFVDKLKEDLSAGPVPKVIGFSNYIWNQGLNMEISKRIKSVSPEVTVIFGGPNFPSEIDKQQVFFNKSPWADFYVAHEGEAAFVNLVELLIRHSGDRDKVKELNPEGTVFMNGQQVVSTQPAPRIDIRDIPSPYLEGFFDGFFKDLKPLVQMARGCPFSCAYCTEGLKQWNRVFFQSQEVVSKELQYIAERVDKSADLFIADSNFGMYPKDIENCHIIADIQDRFSWPRYIHVATGKNNKERVLEASRIIRGALRLSASVQSTDPVVLRNVNRQNISMEKIFDIAREGSTTGANSYSELILALPGDSLNAHFQSIKHVLEAGLLTIRPFTFMLLQDTVMAGQEAREKYQMLTKYRVLPRCFGKYPWVGGDEIHAVEIEEVCVGNSTLSFDDYLKCRLFHLTIEIFFNDGIFSELFKIISFFKIPAFDFLDSIHSGSGRLDKVYSNFKLETKEELWDSPEEIVKFVNKAENLEKYMKGELGANLLFKYKTQALTQDMDVMLDMAYDTVFEMIGRKGGTAPFDRSEFKEFMSQLKRFNHNISVELLNTEIDMKDEFDYDFTDFAGRDLASVLNSKKRYTMRFCHDPEQKKTIEYNKKMFGEDLVGISRLLSQVYVKKCFRQVTDITK